MLEALRERVDQAFTDDEARRAGDNELRPQERSTQLIGRDRHSVKLLRVRSRTNLRKDVVEAAVAQANRLVADRDLRPLPLGITPHKLGHTFASMLVAIGRDPTYVMQQLGHTDPAFTLRGPRLGSEWAASARSRPRS